MCRPPPPPPPSPFGVRDACMSIALAVPESETIFGRLAMYVFSAVLNSSCTERLEKKNLKKRQTNPFNN